jgi:hypothetical protein
VKLKYNENAQKLLELSGYEEENLFFDSVEELPEDLSRHEIKFFVNEAQTKEYETIAFELNQRGIVFDFINNVEISNLIGTDYVDEVQNISGLELLNKTIKEQDPELLKVLEELLMELRE